MLNKIVLSLLRIKYQILFKIDDSYALISLFRMFSTPTNKKIRELDRTLLNDINSKMIIDGKCSTYFEESFGNGPYVLLLHGWEGNAGNMTSFVKPLRDEGYRIVIPNAPAHYSSSGEYCTLRDYQRVVEEYIKKFDVKIIISHSFGTAAALLAIQQFDKGQIHKIVSISAPDRIYDVVASFTSLLKLSPIQKIAFNNYLEARVGISFKEAIVNELIAKSKIETLVIHDKDDCLIPVENAYSLASSLNMNQLYITANQGHFRILLGSNTLERVIPFLTDKIYYSTDDMLLT